ncbi:MAG: hypothetical protein PVH61_08110 [Candidatus Aminicenantes bacterium]|jgi:hypothetical protein
MFRKELQDTLKLSAGILLLVLGIVIFSFFMVRHIFGIKLEFGDILLPATWAAVVLISFYLGSTVFSKERNGKVFEYFFSLPVVRWKALFYKVFPRFLAFLFFSLLHIVLNWIIYQNLYPVMKPGIFFLLLLSIFLFSVSKSLMYKRGHTILIANIFGFSIIFVIIRMLIGLLQFFDEQIAFGYFTLIVGVISFALFIGFVIRFKSLDMSNMFRLSGKNVFQVMLPVAAFFFLFFVVNQVDTSKPADMFTQEDLRPATFDKSNGFYRLWTLGEPIDTDVESEAVINKYRKLFDPGFDNERFLKRFDSRAYFRETSKTTEKIRVAVQTKTGIRPDIWKYLSSPETNIEKLKQDHLFLLVRYQELIDTPIVEDFSPALQWIPRFNHIAWLRIARLYVAVNALDAINGQWEQGAANLLAHTAFARKTVNGSRVLLTNLLGKALASSSLQMLAALMNRDDCPREVYNQILQGLPPLKPGDFRTKNSFIYDNLVFNQYLEKGIYDEIRDQGDFFDHLAHKLFTQKNRTFKYHHQYTKKIIDYESTPPFHWESDLPETRKSKPAFWWFINPGGKRIISQWCAHIQSLLLKTYKARTFYEMTRICAELQLKDDPTNPIEGVLKQLDTYKNTKDPCSGKPYTWNPQKQVLYSIGTDRDDDNGRYDSTTLDTDFALPVRLEGRKPHGMGDL